MAVTYQDKAILADNATFQNRARQAMLTGCMSIKNEGWSVAFHRERETFVVAVVNQADTYKKLFASIMASHGDVAGDATEAGTVTLTTGNIEAQQALITDSHLDDAVAVAFNLFFRTPAS